jgi:hypothetical protein
MTNDEFLINNQCFNDKLGNYALSHSVIHWDLIRY